MFKCCCLTRVSCRPKDWYPLVYEPVFNTYGLEDLVFQIGLMNGGYDNILTENGRLHNDSCNSLGSLCGSSWLLRPCWIYQVSSGVSDPHHGTCGAAEPSALAATYWWMCCCHYTRAAAWKCSIPNNHQQGVLLHYWEALTGADCTQVIWSLWTSQVSCGQYEITLKVWTQTKDVRDPPIPSSLQVCSGRGGKCLFL